MASHSVTVPVSQARDRVRARVPRGSLPLGATVALFTALLILLGWLHFILALQVSETNQQIRSRADELEGLRRANATLLHQVARAQSPRQMESQAIIAGYKPKQPVHVELSPAASGEPQPNTGFGAVSPTNANSVETAEFQASALLEAILTELETWLQAY